MLGRETAKYSLLFDTTGHQTHDLPQLKQNTTTITPQMQFNKSFGPVDSAKIFRVSGNQKHKKPW